MELDNMRNTFELNELRVQERCGRLSDLYLNGIRQVIDQSLDEYNRVFAFRVDLRFPEYFSESIFYKALLADDCEGCKVISRFFASFKSQIEFDLRRKDRDGVRVYQCRPRYIWCKERNDAALPHYHVLILLNKDSYFTLGDFKSDKSLAHKVRKAWRSALNLLCIEEAISLVHFPRNPTYYLNVNSSSFVEQYKDLFYRVSYFAKFDTKHYGSRKRNFGTSLS